MNLITYAIGITAGYHFGQWFSEWANRPEVDEIRRGRLRETRYTTDRLTAIINRN